MHPEIPDRLLYIATGMAHGRNKYQSRENRARVRELLMREWDPIGVAGIPEAADEYDTYVGKVYVMLMVERASSEVIAAYLFDVATKHMGMSAHTEIANRSARAAAAVMALRPEFETH
jgi:hypothetical protein